MKDIITINELAKHLRVNPKTIRRHIKTIPHFIIGKRGCRFWKKDIEVWISKITNQTNHRKRK